MDCEVRVTRVQTEGRYHRSTVLIEDKSRGTVYLVCSSKACLAPTKVVVGEGNVTSVVDKNVEKGFLVIHFVELLTDGVKEISIKNARSADLKQFLTRLCSFLPKTPKKVLNK